VPHDPHLYVSYSAGRDWLSRCIQIATGRRVNHSFFIWQDEHLGWVTLGANANGVTLETWQNFAKTREVIAMFRPRDGMPSLWIGLDALKNEIDERYDYLGLGGMMWVEIQRARGKNVDNPGSKISEWFDPKHKKTFCSQLQAAVIRRTGYQLLGGRLARTIDPGEEMHFIAGDGDFAQFPPPPLAEASEG